MHRSGAALLRPLPCVFLARLSSSIGVRPFWTFSCNDLTGDIGLGSLMMGPVTPLGGLSVVDKDRIRNGCFLLFPLLHGPRGGNF